jgi:hypothetical protein
LGGCRQASERGGDQNSKKAFARKLHGKSPFQLKGKSKSSSGFPELLSLPTD